MTVASQRSGDMARIQGGTLHSSSKLGETGEMEADVLQRSKKRQLSRGTAEEATELGEEARTQHHVTPSSPWEMKGRQTFASKVRGDGGFSGVQRKNKAGQIEDMARRWLLQEEEKEERRKAIAKEKGKGEEGSEPGEAEVGDSASYPSITLSKELIQTFSGPWWGSLIIKVLGRRVSFQFLQARLRALWKPTAELKIITLGEEFFLVQFGEWGDREKVLNEGPWAIFGHHLSVREWAPDFNPKATEIECAAVWARIQDLPLEIYNDHCLSIIGGILGKFIKADDETTAREKARYARICVEINLAKSLVGVFKINGRVFRVEYEGLGLICFGCGRVGHRKEGCPNRKQTKEGGEAAKEQEGGKVTIATPQGGVQPQQVTIIQAERDRAPTEGKESDFALHGPWLTVVRRRRPNVQKRGEGGGAEAQRTFRAGAAPNDDERGQSRRSQGGSTVGLERGRNSTDGGEVKGRGPTPQLRSNGPGTGLSSHSNPTPTHSGQQGRTLAQSSGPPNPTFGGKYAEFLVGHERGVAQSPRDKFQKNKVVARAGTSKVIVGLGPSAWPDADAAFAGFSSKQRTHRGEAEAPNVLARRAEAGKGPKQSSEATWRRREEEFLPVISTAPPQGGNAKRPEELFAGGSKEQIMMEEERGITTSPTRRQPGLATKTRGKEVETSAIAGDDGDK